jgi:alkylation response protein AidB-like acyl-CoA dehydrogenase
MSEVAPKDFGFGADEEMLRDLARKFLDGRLPVETLRDLVSADHEAVYERGERQAWDESLWKEIVELGWSGLAVTEDAGGAQFKHVGIAALIEEVGRHALPSPLVATLNASYVLGKAEAPSGSTWLARVAEGAAASLAFTDARGSWEPADTQIGAREEGDDLLLDGTAFFVQDAFKADFLVVAARLGDEYVLLAVPTEFPGISLGQDQIHDLTRDQATVHFREVRVPHANLLSRDAVGVLEAAWPSILVTVAADLCGCAEWQLQTTVEYAKNRKQFDRPIGFFQAVKHPLVDAMIQIDRARSLLYRASSFIDADDPGSLQAARMAKSAASDAGAFISDRSVQLHGGIGFTWECDVHIFFKRSMHNQALYGDGVYQRSKIAEGLIGPI